MDRNFILAALLSASALTVAAPAQAQDSAAELAAEVAAMRAKIESLEAKVAELQAEGSAAAPVAAAAAPAAVAPTAAAAPAWKGAPEFADKDKGWSFKPRGRLQYDVAYVERPDGVDNPGLGLSNELRRGRIGVSGDIPGGFGYKFEVDFADNDVAITDAILTYEASDDAELTVGQHNNFQSLEEVTSSLFTSFIERAAFTDAFGFERRVGVSAQYQAGDLIAQAGVFTDSIEDLTGDTVGVGDENNAFSLDGRLVYAPKFGDTQLHFGGSAHWRDSDDLVDRGAVTRYRQRPLVHSTDVRFLATGPLRVERETSYGLEAAMINGPFHAAAETHWLKANSFDPGINPGFFGGYAELGYFLTGETRGYKDGKFDRTKVLRPVSEGGLGAFQVNARYDYLDLTDDGIIGGTQNGYQASLIWIPQDYVRFLINYAHIKYDDAAIPGAGGDRDYGIDVIGARAQVDF